MMAIVRRVGFTSTGALWLVRPVRAAGLRVISPNRMLAGQRGNTLPIYLLRSRLPRENTGPGETAAALGQSVLNPY
jgi:hypothetical protein